MILIDWNSLLSGLIGAVVGGLIAAVSTMWAAGRSTKKAFNYSRGLQEAADREACRRFLLAIKTEVETIWDGYQLEAGHHIEAIKGGQGLNLVYKLRQSYFTVYDSNVQFLGYVQDDQLRVTIIRTYALAKGLVDTHLLNNDLLARHEAIKDVDVGTGVFQAGAVRHQQKALQAWQSFGPEVKRAYEQTKDSVGLLLRLLGQSTLLKDGQ